MSSASGVKGITKEAFRQALSHLMPVGFAWPRHLQSVQQAFIAGLAAAMMEMHDVMHGTVRQWMPHRTCSRIEEWEEALGLPDPCTGYIDDPIHRRELMLSRFSGIQLPYEDSSPAAIGNLEALCRAAGYIVTITYDKVFRIGDRVGARLGRTGALNIFYPQVCVPFRVGNRVGQRLSICPPPPLELMCLLERIVPSRFSINVYS